MLLLRTLDTPDQCAQRQVVRPRHDIPLGNRVGVVYDLRSFHWRRHPHSAGGMYKCRGCKRGGRAQDTFLGIEPLGPARTATAPERSHTVQVHIQAPCKFARDLSNSTVGHPRLRRRATVVKWRNTTAHAGFAAMPIFTNRTLSMLVPGHQGHESERRP
ncbi:uncharacterized protein LAESUDRAFT_729575 [Laetiporus sulphureus 93-53]|uniref:Uncharacterized protein n=1 Tax=Laetiporus sulphureus 93-53 TaxID=1314785 RepID=A0A165CM92_9APHY|nr:uncharacterized protein LAESUDRAFT_729575 [Laetiporus sulphureus 93-53]KZT03063.1 hypothetical protein LAESUDRAFT_729575 [Laetiporus sulphureus 93-53]